MCRVLIRIKLTTIVYYCSREVEIAGGRQIYVAEGRPYHCAISKCLPYFVYELTV